jgi:integrase
MAGEKNRLVGSIEWRGPGKARLTVSAGFGPNGKRIRHRKTVKAKNDVEAEKLLAAFIAEVEEGSYIDPSKLKFKDFVDTWLKDYAEANLAPKTYHRYKEILDSRIIPELGYARMDQIKPLHIVQFENSLRKDGVRKDGKRGGLSEKTIMQHHRILSIIFNTAVQWDIIRENPVKRVTPPKVKKKEIPAYDEEQTATMLAALEQEPIKYQALIHLALVTGLRRSELMALEWSDIDFESGTLEVTKSRQYAPGIGVHERDTTKNETSDRLISLPQSTLNILQMHKLEQEDLKEKLGSLWQGSNKLFTTNEGADMHPDTPTSWFPKFLKKHKLPHMNFHGLRHTAATILINKGVNIKAVSARLGHARTSTTVDIYAKALRKADKVCSDVMDNIISGVPKTVPKSKIIQLVHKRKAR